MSEIESSSERDQEMELLRAALDSGSWPAELRGYEAQRNQIHKLGALLCKDDRIILPKDLRQRAMESAHGGHIGVVAMKRVLRDFFWWPQMSKQAEKFVKSCETCNTAEPTIEWDDREIQPARDQNVVGCKVGRTKLAIGPGNICAPSQHVGAALQA